MTVEVDDERLDDVAALSSADSHEMLRAVATSAAQVRRGLTAARDAGLEGLAADGRPRSVVVAGMGGSGIAGDVLSALTAPAAPVPVVVHRGAGLPAWVGAADLVVPVSCSGSTAETLAAADEAIRRGCRLLGVSAADSPLAERCRNARAAWVQVVPELTPRSSFWGLATPLLVAAARLGLLDLGAGDGTLEAAAQRLEQIAEACRPDRETFVNPAKSLALELAGSLPMVWGVGQTGGVAAYRLVCQLAENAKLPAIPGVLPEAHHNQVVALDGALAGGVEAEDIFRDRVDEEQPVRVRLVLVHDDDGNESTASQVAASQELAEARGVPVTLLSSQGQSPVERLASLVGLVDYATVYLALGQAVDPTPVDAIDELKRRLAAR